MVDLLENDKYNVLLPYPATDAPKILAIIKDKISQAVQQNDVRPGLQCWSSQLESWVYKLTVILICYIRIILKIPLRLLYI